MEVPEFHTGGTNYYQARIITADHVMVPDSKRYTRVRAIKLDTLIATARTVGFVKCDIEGHELACLAGARMILTSYRPAWLVEVSGDPDEPGTNASQLFDMLAGYSYAPWWFNGQALVERRPGDRSVNYFFLHPHHIIRLRAKAPRLLDATHARAGEPARV